MVNGRSQRRLAYRIKTSLVPIIIDFGKAHVIYKNRHFGNINMFKTSTIQDILTILTTSIYEITERENLNRKDVRDLVYIANFLAGTTYRPKKFLVSGKFGTGDLRYFFRNAKKYTNLVSSEKYELEEKTPLNFVDYLLSNFKDLPIQSTNEIKLNFQGNALQIYKYMFSKTPEEKIESFLSTFKKIKKFHEQNAISNASSASEGGDRSKGNNSLCSFYLRNVIKESIFSVNNFLQSFLE